MNGNYISSYIVLHDVLHEELLVFMSENKRPSVAFMRLLCERNFRSKVTIKGIQRRGKTIFLYKGAVRQVFGDENNFMIHTASPFP